MTRFDRSSNPFTKSLALDRFNSDFAEVNNFYWIGSAESETFSFTIKSHPLDSDPMTSLTAPEKYARTLGHDMEELKKRVKTEIRWRRLLTVMLITSSLERYVVAISTAAANSDPCLTPGFPKKVDGALLKKYNLQMQQPDLLGMTKGDWPQRISVYRKTYGSVPSVLQNSLGELEKLRKTRNRIAHEFGSPETDIPPHMNVALGARRADSLETSVDAIGHKTILKWLRLAGAVANAIDAHLMRDFVGGFEALEIYLEWKRDPSGFEKYAKIEMSGSKKSTEYTRFSTVLGTLLDQQFGREYVISLQKYAAAL